MQRSFLTNFLFLLGLNIVVKPFYVLGVEAEIQNRVGAEAFGNYFALISFSFLLNILLDMGISNYNTRRVATMEKGGSIHFGSMMGMRLILVGVYAVVLMICAWGLGYSSDQLGIVALLGLNQALAALVLFFRSNLGGLHLFKQDSVVSVLDRLALIGICSALLWGGITATPFQIEWLVYAQTASYILAACVALAILARHASPLSIKLNKAFSKDLIRKSAPFAILIFWMSVYLRTDSVMLERLHENGAVETGIYAMAFRFFDAGNMVAYLFAILLLPMFSRLLAKGESVAPVLEQAYRLLVPGAVLVAAWSVAFSHEVMDWRYVSHAAEAAPVFAWLMIGFAGFAFNYLFGSLLTASGDLRQVNRLAAVVVVGNIIGNALFIPTYGAWAAAVTSAATHALMAIGQFLLVRKSASWHPGKAFWLRTSALLSGTALIAWACTIMPGSWGLRSGAFALAGLGLSMALGYLRPTSLLQLAKGHRSRPT